jgi:DNA-binding NarL/FixJ family response regulator
VNDHSERGTARVLVVEDHPVVAEGLVALLEGHPRLDVLGWANSVAEAERLAESETVDVAIVDFRLPDGTGADAALRIRMHRPGAAVVFLSADDSDQAMLAAIEAGASGYLVKSAPGPEIVEAVRRAADGDASRRPVAALLSRQRRVAGQVDDRTRRLESSPARVRDSATDDAGHGQPGSPAGWASPTPPCAATCARCSSWVRGPA